MLVVRFKGDRAIDLVTQCLTAEWAADLDMHFPEPLQVDGQFVGTDPKPEGVFDRLCVWVIARNRWRYDLTFLKPRVVRVAGILVFQYKISREKRWLVLAKRDPPIR